MSARSCVREVLEFAWSPPGSRTSSRAGDCANRLEAEAEAKSEPLLSSFLHASIVSHDSFSRSLAFVLANRLEDTTLHSTELSDIFHTVLAENPGIKQAALADIVAFKERVRQPQPLARLAVAAHPRIGNRLLLLECALHVTQSIKRC